MEGFGRCRHPMGNHPRIFTTYGVPLPHDIFGSFAHFLPWPWPRDLMKHMEVFWKFSFWVRMPIWLFLKVTMVFKRMVLSMSRPWKDLIASAFKVLVARRFWPGSNQEKRLARASRRLHHFAKSRKLSLQVRKLTPKNLGWGTGKCPEAHVKGYDTYVILSFLAEEIQLYDCGALDENECLFL